MLKQSRLGQQGQHRPGGLTIHHQWLPEADFSYFVTPNLAVEWILTAPQKQKQKQTVYCNDAEIGSFKHLPPPLTAQHRFTGMSFRPGVGAGMNCTNRPDVNIVNGVVGLKHSSWGLPLQAGVDAGKFKVDPLLLGIGFGKRF